MAAKVKVEEEAANERALRWFLRCVQRKGRKESESRQMNDEATRKSVSPSASHSQTGNNSRKNAGAPLKCSISQSNFSC